MLMTQIKPGSVVLFHDTYSSTVDLVYQFIPVLKANGYRLVTVSELLGRAGTGQQLRQPRERSTRQRTARHPGRPDSDVAQHPVAQADAQLPDHRHSGPEFGRTEQRCLVRKPPAGT